MNNKNPGRRFFAFSAIGVLACLLLACSEKSVELGGEPGDSYAVDLTRTPVKAEGLLILYGDKSGREEELSGTFQVGADSVNIMVSKEVARAARINVKKPFESEVTVTISGEHSKSSGYRQIFEISAIQK